MMGSPARAGEFRRCARVLVGCVHIGRWEVRLGRVETFETFYTPPNLACLQVSEGRSALASEPHQSSTHRSAVFANVFGRFSCQQRGELQHANM